MWWNIWNARGWWCVCMMSLCGYRWQKTLWLFTWICSGWGWGCGESKSRGESIYIFFRWNPAQFFNCLHLGLAESQPPEPPREFEELTRGLRMDRGLGLVLNEGSCESLNIYINIWKYTSAFDGFISFHLLLLLLFFSSTFSSSFFFFFLTVVYISSSSSSHPRIQRQSFTHLKLDPNATHEVTELCQLPRASIHHLQLLLVHVATLAPMRLRNPQAYLAHPGLRGVQILQRLPR